ncbi:TrmB family transcriptional regulator [Halobellus sp. Atlit-38R]|uniref:TrmB family transcriptional regulator n=1 Tax=Halobellus sp. Atlit-38R TaxID=2282131 RepID=UPI000EF1D21C|nr:helix-turn-helix domain-containing protein [Halobellus sp. Atlit-38R]RLM83747.1 TrmB family transcriptional regulator [Halobellus sp. Atlit-38R]
MTHPSDTSELLGILDFTEYEEQALQGLIEIGRTTAPDLSEATGIPKARIYGVLEELADAGYIKIIPGRPKEYESKPPAEILEQATENERQAYKSYEQTIEQNRDAFLSAFEPLYASGSSETSPTEELFYVVDVGEPSERKTRGLYHDATEQIHILTKSFEYFDAVEPAVADALDAGRTINILFLDPELLDAGNRDIQRSIIERIRTEYPAIDIRFSATRLPWRGTIIDPSMDYDSGQAILLVEEKDIPLHKRQAAVTENGSFVAGLNRYFELTWAYDTLAEDPYA